MFRERLFSDDHHEEHEGHEAALSRVPAHKFCDVFLNNMEYVIVCAGGDRISRKGFVCLRVLRGANFRERLFSDDHHEEYEGCKTFP